MSNPKNRNRFIFTWNLLQLDLRYGKDLNARQLGSLQEVGLITVSEFPQLPAFSALLSLFDFWKSLPYLPRLSRFAVLHVYWKKEKRKKYVSLLLYPFIHSLACFQFLEHITLSVVVIVVVVVASCDCKLKTSRWKKLEWSNTMIKCIEILIITFFLVHYHWCAKKKDCLKHTLDHLEQKQRRNAKN